MKAIGNSASFRKARVYLRGRSRERERERERGEVIRAEKLFLFELCPFFSLSAFDDSIKAASPAFDVSPSNVAKTFVFHYDIYSHLHRGTTAVTTRVFVIRERLYSFV